MKNSFFVFVLIASVFSGGAFAQGNLSWGALQINPYLNLSQQYRSNIYLEADDETSDLILFITPGARFYLPTSIGDAELDYSADLLYYRDNSRNDTQRHLASFKGDWMIGRDYDLLIENRLHITDDPATSELTDLEDRMRKFFNIALSRQARVTAVGAGFTSIRDKYDDRDDLDRTENYLTLDGYYRFRPRTDLRIQYRYGEIDYDETVLMRDASYHEVTAGVGGRLSPKVTGEVRAGYQSRDYDNPEREDFSSLVVYGSVVHQLNPRVRSTLSVTRGAEESTFAGNSYYAYTAVDIAYRHMMGRKHVLNAGAGFRNHDYPEAVEGFSREDDIWRFSLGWDYNLRDWVRLGVSYDHRTRSSTFVPHNYDYTDNRVTVRCNMQF